MIAQHSNFHMFVLPKLEHIQTCIRCDQDFWSCSCPDHVTIDEGLFLMGQSNGEEDGNRR